MEIQESVGRTEMNGSEIVLELRSLKKSYRGSTAVDGVSLDIRAGEFFAIIGSSGCGKSTTLRLIAGLDEPTSGTISIFGQDVTGVPAHRGRSTPCFKALPCSRIYACSRTLCSGFVRRRCRRASTVSGRWKCSA